MDRQSLTSTMDDTTGIVSREHRPVFRQMNYGLLRHYYSLDCILTKLLNKPLADKHTDLRILLLLGLYQIQYMDIPAHACVDETVNTTRQLGKSWARGLVNGVLRRFIREREYLAELLSENEVYGFDHPQWLIEKIQQSWPSMAESILRANNHQAPMTLRVNTRQINRSDYLALLNSHHIAGNVCQFSNTGITLQNARDVTLLPGFNSGWVSVQDEAAQLAADVLALEPEQTVLDACAAPGGKSSHILEHMPDVSLICLELDSRRIHRIQENLTRLGLATNAEIILGDASQPDDWWNGDHFDRILLDAPCSATGIIRRHPDIKMLRKESDIDKLAQQQLLLLKSLWPLLKKDGILVYSTCSILPEENDIPVHIFLSQTTDASELTFNADWGVKTEHGRQLFPREQGHDGFFYARLRKNHN